MIKYCTFLFLGALFLFSCTNSGETTQASDSTAATPVSITKTVSAIEPGLYRADSLQVLFYDDPDGDSLRYTRYFTYTETDDTAQIRSLLQELDQVYVQEPKARPCRSEGKLYLLKGEDVLKTVYFSARQDSCRYFYFIKDGAFVYLPLTDAAENWLKERRKMAKKP